MSSFRRTTVTLALTVVAFWGLSSPAAATVHEITASYCSGGSVGNFNGLAVDPPGLHNFGTTAFARPVLASGAVSGTTFTTTSHPNLKVREGLFAPAIVLSTTTVDHPSEACKAMQP